MSFRGTAIVRLYDRPKECSGNFNEGGLLIFLLPEGI